jgi:hypothetical protein
MQSQGSQEVQSDFRLGQKYVPQMKWKSWINGGWPCHKVFFKSTNVPLSGVGEMTVGGDKFIFHVIGSEKVFSKRWMPRCQGFEVWV